jgi:hypothetical protein
MDVVTGRPEHDYVSVHFLSEPVSGWGIAIIAAIIQGR